MSEVKKMTLSETLLDSFLFVANMAIMIAAGTCNLPVAKPSKNPTATQRISGVICTSAISSGMLDA
ncbi:hypothetical protein GWO13_00270 [Candidatus Bathyarchaeota archaeon]|nr:hypothetical protein [Candidatus Bathyarchaeota archaeon]